MPLSEALSGQRSRWALRYTALSVAMQDFWMKTAFLSIILAVMNLLPIPGLDGGHALFTLWEIITRRKPSEKFLEVAQYVGLMIILALLVYANGNDIYRFFIK